MSKDSTRWKVLEKDLDQADNLTKVRFTGIDAFFLVYFTELDQIKKIGINKFNRLVKQRKHIKIEEFEDFDYEDLMRKRLKVKTKEELAEEAKIKDVFDYLWNIYPNRKGRKSDKLRKEVYKHREEIEKAISNYKKDKELKINGGYKEYMHASTFFGGRWHDYFLDSSHIQNIINNEKITKISHNINNKYKNGYDD